MLVYAPDAQPEPTKTSEHRLNETVCWARRNGVLALVVEMIAVEVIAVAMANETTDGGHCDPYLSEHYFGWDYAAEKENGCGPEVECDFGFGTFYRCG